MQELYFLGTLPFCRGRPSREVEVRVSRNGVGMAVYDQMGEPVGCHVHADLSVAEPVRFCVNRKRLLEALGRCQDVVIEPDQNRLRFEWGRYKHTLATHSDEPTEAQS